MIRFAEIDNLLGLVGFRQPTLSGYDILDAGTIASSSGLFVDDISGLITVKNIKECQEDKDITDAEFNTFLDNRMTSSFLNLCKSVFSDRDLIENRVLYPFENDWTNTLTNATDFVGYEIDVAKQKNINVVLNKIMLAFSAVDTVTVYLFHSSKKAAIQSQAITTVLDSTVHTALNWDLPAADSTIGGKYYVGYLRSGLTASAYDRDFQSANSPTSFNCLDIKSIQISGWNASTLFDVNDIEYTSETWGMNFDISSFKDYTSLVVENEDRFSRGLQLQIAADLLNLLATSTRSNKDERMIKAEALYDLNGNRSNPEIPQSVGVLRQLADEIKLIKKMVNPPKMQINTLR